jgi:hypothetical protein
MTAPTKLDGKQVTDVPLAGTSAPAAEPQAHAAPAFAPLRMMQSMQQRVGQQRLGLIGLAFGVSATAAAVTTLIAALLAHKPSPKGHYLFGSKPTRHFGYGRYHIGRFGTAWIAYTYKLPALRYQLPEIAFRLSAIRMKLPQLDR